MSRVGRWAAASAVALGVLTVATWSRGERRVDAVSPASGADLFLAKGCASCHVGPDTTPLFSGFPSLGDASSWAGDRRPGVSAENYLAESMAAPDVFVSPAFNGGVGPTSGMPQLRLTSDEIDDLVAYLLDG